MIEMIKDHIDTILTVDVTILGFVITYIMTKKNLKDEIANAAQKGMASSTLFISEVFADEGVTYKRARCRAQGRMYRRLKRTSHLTIKLNVLQK